MTHKLNGDVTKKHVFLEPSSLEEGKVRLVCIQTDLAEINAQLKDTRLRERKDDYADWRARAQRARAHMTREFQELQLWISAKRLETRTALHAAEMEAAAMKRARKDARAAFYLEHSGVSLDDPDSLILASYSLFKKLEKEEVEFTEEEDGLIQTLSRYVLLKSNEKISN